jgi:hypothetical protein
MLDGLECIITQLEPESKEDSDDDAPCARFAMIFTSPSCVTYMILSNTTLPKCRNQASPSAEDAIVNNESFRRHPPPAGIREPAQYNRKVDGSMTAE